MTSGLLKDYFRITSGWLPSIKLVFREYSEHSERTQKALREHLRSTQGAIREKESNPTLSYSRSLKYFVLLLFFLTWYLLLSMKSLKTPVQEHFYWLYLWIFEFYLKKGFQSLHVREHTEEYSPMLNKVTITFV